MTRMRATKFLRLKSASRAPDTGKAMHQAFDAAWAIIAGHYGTNAATVEGARLRLAECVDIVTPDVGMEAEDITRLALDMLRIIDAQA
jgi:hypothetical protein